MFAARELMRFLVLPPTGALANQRPARRVAARHALGKHTFAHFTERLRAVTRRQNY
jgi:hypothetical protein